jgi:superfamily II DNA or RNA helicase
LNFKELTSRVSSGEIPEILKQLDTKMPDALDYLLCTNMLSVGVDVQRLGVMIVDGQPKNHSEYIQATGRVGRREPGLIISLYNAQKPRDLSHFENFKQYHSAFYKYVEPISMTPFSARSRDKGLFGVLVAILRLQVRILSKQPNMLTTSTAEVNNAIEQLTHTFENRIKNIDNEQLGNTLQEIGSLLEAWEAHATSHDAKALKYKTTQYTTPRERETTRFLLTSVEKGEVPLDGLTHTPNSLRDAEEVHDVFFFVPSGTAESKEDDEDDQ